jgi:hypothetical protein
MIAWRHLIERTRELAPRERDDIRVANLAVAAQLAALRGTYGRRRRLDGPALADEVHALALDELDVDRDAILTWGALAADAFAAAVAFASVPAGTDGWVQAFQGADPTRKSRGAYATPQALAAPMARLLLRGASLPRRVVDPSAGAGGLLVAVLRELRRADPATALAEHARRLHGVELDPVTRELCCLLVWLSAQRALPIAEIASRIVAGNAITRDWWVEEPFDALIMNPPWDSLRQRASADVASDLGREATVARLEHPRPGAPGLPPLFTAHGRGDRNLYKAFVELAPHLLGDGARLVALLPGAWSSDLGTRDLRRAYLRQLAIEQWSSFENLRAYFPIDARYKFGIIAGRRDDAGSTMLRARGFCADARDLGRRHVEVDASAIADLGGPAELLPDLTSVGELQLMLRYRRRGRPFFSPSGPFGQVVYQREIDLTEDRKRGGFQRLDALDGARPLGDGRWALPGGPELVPLVEGRMVGQYEFHEKSFVEGSGRTAVWTYANGNRLGACRPQFLVEAQRDRRHRIAICDVTSATNTRTMLATWVPPGWRCGNTAPVLVFETERRALAALAVLNSMVFDWLVRRVVAGLHLNRFYLDALSWPALGEASVAELAAAAAALQALSPRYVDLAAPRIGVRAADLELVDAHALVERVVAAGYGLSRTALRVIYSPDRSDRRGFWRHFAGDPNASAVVDAVLAGSPPTAARLAPQRRAR